ASNPDEFFGRYIEVTPHSRLVWTNDEGGDGGPVTTVTFEERGDKTLLVMHELYPSKEALDAAGTGAADAMVETFEQLDELLVARGASGGRSESRRPRTFRVGEEKANMIRSAAVALRTATVSFSGPSGIRHSVDVTAESVYEASALGV